MYGRAEINTRGADTLPTGVGGCFVVVRVISGENFTKRAKILHCVYIISSGQPCYLFTCLLLLLLLLCLGVMCQEREFLTYFLDYTTFAENAEKLNERNDWYMTWIDRFVAQHEGIPVWI